MGINKELFCTYQQSLDLKQLGFEDDCFDDYIPDNPGIEKEDIGLLYSDRLDSGREHYFIPSSILISAPLKSQAFKFFREKYDFNCNIVFNGKHYYVLIDEDYLSDSVFPKEFTYEEAENACIDALITHVKSQQ